MIELSIENKIMLELLHILVACLEGRAPLPLSRDLDQLQGDAMRRFQQVTTHVAAERYDSWLRALGEVGLPVEVARRD